MRGFPIKHGEAIPGQKTRTYKIWNNMVGRCHTPSGIRNPRYGGRGIAVCERWRDYRNFLADMGEAPPGMMIERQDNDKGYEPGNCVWATRQQQNENRCNTIWVEIDGQRKTVAAWARELGVDKNKAYWRIRSGWTARESLGLDPHTYAHQGVPKSAEHKEKLSAAAKQWRREKREGLR